jgi:hypothetical protein
MPGLPDINRKKSSALDPLHDRPNHPIPVPIGYCRHRVLCQIAPFLVDVTAPDVMDRSLSSDPAGTFRAILNPCPCSKLRNIEQA